ncbi:hypothetical protein PIB30_081904 [Stylosanthes scabra]|uniref:Retrotransposon Copia-like N-terminal domain-containing protein n=1 Tax=Stylosanthes scabra TaxID=79078 RepID=A0ABU6ST57_9FABA|nr:hypothetical protein [Stylosanthes scabra]
MEITLSNSSTKNFSLLAEKLNEDNYFTWRYLTLLTINSLGMEDHLDPSKIPIQFVTDDAKKATIESETYKVWKYQDLTLATWLVASMSDTFNNKPILHKISTLIEELLEEEVEVAEIIEEEEVDSISPRGVHGSDKICISAVISAIRSAICGYYPIHRVIEFDTIQSAQV